MQALYSVLHADAAVAAIVAGRIYPLQVPDDLRDNKMPCIVYRRVTGEVAPALEGDGTLQSPVVQVDSYAQTYREAQALADAVKTAMQAETAQFRATFESDDEDFVDDLRLYVVSADYQVWKS